MTTTYETNAQGEAVKVTTSSNGSVSKELDRPPPTPVDPCTWLLDLGPFFDRFGAAKMAVLTSPDAVVQAILKDVGIRKWIDLKNPEVAQSVAYIGSKVPSVTTALQTAILTMPVVADENLALRRLYFS